MDIAIGVDSRLFVGGSGVLVRQRDTPDVASLKGFSDALDSHQVGPSGSGGMKKVGQLLVADVSIKGEIGKRCVGFHICLFPVKPSLSC